MGDDNVLVADVRGRKLEVAAEGEFKDRDVAVDEPDKGRVCSV